jgi:uncharacterized repeat protein (TIGR03803 family)
MMVVGASAIAALVSAAGYGGEAHASKLQVLMSFGNLRGTDSGATPVADAAGNLYVTATLGGANGDGAVIELSPPAEGRTTWTRTVIHTFDGTDGQYADTGLIVDGAGNLYGGTEGGGSHGYGVVYELSPPAAGKTSWKETVLHAFDGADGFTPQASLIADTAGNLYGTTNDGGANGDGVVFELIRPAPGRSHWKETVLHSFSGTDGMIPAAPLMQDAAGNLYGTTAQGGASGLGVVYELSPPVDGRNRWTATVLHDFDGADGQAPVSSLVADAEGNLYGTAEFGGSHLCPQGLNCGVVFELRRPAVGQKHWSEKVLHSFDGSRGYRPYAGLFRDGGGNLYGTTAEGGPAGCDGLGCGLVFQLSPPISGQTRWTEKVLYSFNGARASLAFSAIMPDGVGGFYGTTDSGGSHGDGVVYKLTP